MTGRSANQRLWARIRDDLVKTVEGLGFPSELGEAIAKYNDMLNYGLFAEEEDPEE